MRSIPRFLSSSLSWAHAVSSVSVGRCCRAKHFGASFESEWPVKAQKHTHTHTNEPLSGYITVHGART